jgi:uncharacterized protein involved in exopolysaccharide biosynthesis
MNELGMAKLRGVMRRRKICIVATIVGVLGVAAAIVWQIDPGYRAQVVIRAAESQPAKDYVPPTVAEQIGERLKSLRLSVMARPLVARAAHELDVFRHYPKRPPDEVIDDIRARMDVKLEGDDTFLLTYSDPSPERAQALANRVAQLFMEAQVERRQQVASATTQALRDEVEALRPQVDAAERAVREFKLAHYGSLPEQAEGNLRNLDQTTMELNIQTTNLDLDLERRRALLAAALSPLRHHEETLAGALYDARTRYTEDHAEVQRIRAEYERVKEQRIADERDLYAKVRRANPELLALDGEIARTRAIIDGLRARQREVRARVEATAKNGQELAGLTGTFDALKDKYTSTLGRLRDAELAEHLERGLAQMRFDLVEGASLPVHAATPNRPLLAVGALVLALALGLGVGFAVDASDTSFRDPEQLHAYAPELSILACVPRSIFEPSLKKSSNRAEA